MHSDQTHSHKSFLTRKLESHTNYQSVPRAQVFQPMLNFMILSHFSGLEISLSGLAAFHQQGVQSVVALCLFF